MRKELKKLKKVELLEILYQQNLKIDNLNEKITQLEKQLADKTICIAEAGSIAEAALKLTNIFEEAQKAIELYKHNVK